MATSTEHKDFGPRAETNPYMKRAWQMGNSLIPIICQTVDKLRSDGYVATDYKAEGCC